MKIQQNQKKLEKEISVEDMQKITEKSKAKEATSRRRKRSFCRGCANDFYNGRNPYGIEECWSLPTAKLVKRKEVGLWQRPPWVQKPEKFLSCYRRKGYVYVDPDREY